MGFEHWILTGSVLLFLVVLAVVGLLGLVAVARSVRGRRPAPAPPAPAAFTVSPTSWPPAAPSPSQSASPVIEDLMGDYWSRRESEKRRDDIRGHLDSIIKWATSEPKSPPPPSPNA